MATPPRRSPHGGHDAHFLQRLDRMSHEHLELSLGLYRDHELVAYILKNVRLPEGAERVAIALADEGRGPHVIVARDGHFVTALGEGMSTGPHPVVRRAQLDALSGKLERVREGLELARKRGMDGTALLSRIENSGWSLSREDFLAARATLGPAAPLLFNTYSAWAESIEELLPFLATKEPDPRWRPKGEADVLRGAWAMAHTATILVDTVSREWVDGWAEVDAKSQVSAWSFLTRLGSFPFVVRSAWLAARLGPAVAAGYKARFRDPFDPYAGRDAGYGLLALGLRHERLRAENWHVLRARKPEAEDPDWIGGTIGIFQALVQLMEDKEQDALVEGLSLGRQRMVDLTAHLPESSPHRFADPAAVPDDLALTALLNLWGDGLRDENAAAWMFILLANAARARAEDFYFPAQLLHAFGDFPVPEAAASLVDMRRQSLGARKPVVRADRVGRNDPCPCGSGKKYKKCHGG